MLGSAEEATRGEEGRFVPPLKAFFRVQGDSWPQPRPGSRCVAGVLLGKPWAILPGGPPWGQVFPPRAGPLPPWLSWKRGGKRARLLPQGPGPASRNLQLQCFSLRRAQPGGSCEAAGGRGPRTAPEPWEKQSQWPQGARAPLEAATSPLGVGFSCACGLCCHGPGLTEWLWQL